MQNLRDIKEQQAELRVRLIAYYTHSNLSMLILSKKIGVPYTTFWGFMHSGSIGYKNIIKISEWLDAQLINNPRSPGLF